ncbi:hypothetical protein [Pseudomonas sp. Gutcm_11s]|uniref:hypothetical protein n=1 Tax=Pseudomonas sp. Gutcm_11s TaxID=3026088 RepID=UPI00236059BC|nr:hypothetical protein [Pseudomonas sp. Gutcm_11s]MDD0841167.1 hypothetical protein [Pseudomonas sp. Gutcm_11s]
MLMTGKSTLFLGLAAALSTTVVVGYYATAKDAQAAYVAGENVYVCPKVKNKNSTFDCRVAGEATPRFKQLPFVDRETGERYLETVHGYLPVYCSDLGCAVVNDWDGFKQGTLVGRGAKAHYLIDSGWYLDFNSDGDTTAYRSDVGPQQGQDAYASSKALPANYGKESCYDEEVASILEDNPNFPISFDMMNEIRVGCGLPKEE